MVASEGEQLLDDQQLSGEREQNGRFGGARFEWCRVAAVTVRAVARLDVEADLVNVVAAAPAHAKVRSRGAASDGGLPALGYDE